ncbi:PfkB family carbohydrate kinase [Kineosporia mesophila]|uniref:PfkB family carbohydrate kinase n=1 Tax=Kineosporia mesophila TaxID=566012 RepID=UPI001E401E3D|nr:PfkB family carbohydrate kinase [Kineosporia mesophila]
MNRSVVVLGDVVLDRDVHGIVTRIAPDAPVPVLDTLCTVERPGGAGLAALLCAAPGIDVTLIAPLARDEAGRRLEELLAPHVTVVPLEPGGPTRTKTRLRAAGQSLLRLDEGGPGSPPVASVGIVEKVLGTADVVLVPDYGAGLTRHPQIRRLLARAARRLPVIWDPHPRGGAPVPGCLLVTPNLAEAIQRGEAGETDPVSLADALRTRWRVRAVCVTDGANGAYLGQAGSEVLYLPAPAAQGDPCGAGDRFAASVAVAVSRGRVLSEAVGAAVGEASAWVAAGGAASFRPPTRLAPAGRVLAIDPVTTPVPDPPIHADHVVLHEGVARGWPAVEQHVARVRAAGGRIVATGGCFDLLHVGHISCLQAARRAGDTLVVLLNSDASVRRLKGPQRPVVPQDERAQMLAAIECVDAVVIFDEDDPVRALGRLRPDIWAKGGDYGGMVMPEAALVRSWGGRVLLLPYVRGRSTTALLERAGPG